MITYFYRGDIERTDPRSRSYRWVRGYSEAGTNGAVTFPWLSWKECQEDAKRRGHEATFHDKR
jgi:hypothetical protein